MIQHWRVITEKAYMHCKPEKSLQDVGTMIFFCTKTSAGALCPDSGIALQGKSGLTGEGSEKSNKNGQKSVKHGR